jgi:GNAT superfamily N-acetyltransferase
VNSPPHLALRPATAADLDFLDAMHTLCMREHVDRLYPWIPDFFRRTYDPSLTRVITVDGRDVGMVKADHDDAALHLRIIAVLPEHQGRGIGAWGIGVVLREAAALGLPVMLQVLRGNPARKLYERLGFRDVGETATHHLMSTGGGDREEDRGEDRGGKIEDGEVWAPLA